MRLPDRLHSEWRAGNHEDASDPMSRPKAAHGSDALPVPCGFPGRAGADAGATPGLVADEPSCSLPEPRLERML